MREGLPCADALQERALVYRMLGRFYLEALTQDELDEMDEQMFLAFSQAADDELAKSGYEDMYRYLRRRNTATCQTLRTDFTRTFLGVREYKGVAAVPYESQYLTIEGEGISAIRLAVLRCYKAHGVMREPDLDTAEDHLAFEMEFMALLSERCAQAVAQKDESAALGALRDQAAFLDEHIMRWFPRFYNLANCLIETRFYRGVLKVTKAFLEEDQALLASIEPPACSA